MRCKVLAVLLIACFTMVNFNVSAAPAEGVYLYEHSNYEGKCIKLTSDVSNLVDYDFNDKISSIRIIGNYSVTVYEHIKYEGWSKTYDENVRYVGDRVNDRISSIIIRRNPRPGPQHGPKPERHRRYQPEPAYHPKHGPGQAPGVYLYERTNYGGRWIKLDYNVGRLGRYDFNDKTASLRIIGRYKVTVYQDDNYRGWAYTYYNDIPNLGRRSYQISSIRIQPL
jgi:hypothetical protein